MWGCKGEEAGRRKKKGGGTQTLRDTLGRYPKDVPVLYVNSTKGDDKMIDNLGRRNLLQFSAVSLHS